MDSNPKDNLSYEEKLRIARRYTKENEDLARDVVNGSYRDIVIIKARYKNRDENYFGAFSVYLSIELSSVVGLVICTGKLPNIYKVKPFETWKIHERSIRDIIEVELDNNSLDTINKLFIDRITSNTIENILSYIKLDNYDKLTNLFSKIIEELFSIDNIAIQIDTEKLTSVDFELISTVRIEQDNNESLKEQIEKKDLSTDSNEFAGNMIIDGKVILSPVDGKDIKAIVKGDYIKVLITEKTEKAINIATKLSFYDKENQTMKTITGEVISHKKNDMGHEIHILIAPYILVKVSESEDVKVATISSVSEAEEDEKLSKKSLIITLLALFFLILTIVLTLLYIS